MSRKSVLILEDRVALRAMLHDALTIRGFRVVSAKDGEEAWKRIAEAGSDFDVALLDVELEGSTKSGLDFGMDLKNYQSEWPPEFMIFSAYDKPEYYQAAFKLGAAAYLRKGVYGGDSTDPGAAKTLRLDVLAEHVRALALRRALRSERPGMANVIRRIAESSRSREEALERFCGEFLSGELQAALGGRFVLLLSHQKGMTIFPGGALDPLRSGVFKRIEDAVHGRLGEAEPLVVAPEDAESWLYGLPSAEQEIARDVLVLLEGSAFVPLGETKKARLSLGLMPDSESALRPSESTAELAKILGRYLPEAFVTSLTEITEIFAELNMKRRVLLKATSDFCLYLGQEVEFLLQESEENRQVQGGSAAPAGKLHVLAEELRDAGELLIHVESLPREQQPAVQMDLQLVEMSGLVSRTWHLDLARRLELTDPGFLQVGGQCTVKGQPDQLELAVSQILGWLGRRLAKLALEGRPALFVRCYPTQTGGAEVAFEEQSSRRLPPRLRESLFSPFFSYPVLEPVERIPDKGRRLGLYLARALAESAGGTLQDRSTELTGGLGHRFVLELPSPQSPLAAER